VKICHRDIYSIAMANKHKEGFNLRRYYILILISISPFFIYLLNNLRTINGVYRDWVLNIPILIIIGFLTFLIFKDKTSLIASPIVGFLYSIFSFLFPIGINTESLFGSFIYSLFFAFVSFFSTLLILVIYNKILKGNNVYKSQ